MHRRAGFTLLEIMIVVAILGLVLMMALPSVVDARERSRRMRAKSDLRTIAGAVEQLAWDTGQWPGHGRADRMGDEEVEDLGAPQGGVFATDGKFRNWQGPYMRRMPRDSWGKPYFFDPDYLVDGESVSVVGSYGPNGVGLNDYDDDDVWVVVSD